MTFHDLPRLNAVLNGTSALFLLAGYACIRQRKITAHRACMVTALVSSCLFLVSYLIYHAEAGTTRFTGQGWIRPLYFTILTTHTFLAAIIVPLVILTLRRALRAEFPRHARIARWTLPIWLYVSATGVAIYFMLYVLYPSVRTH